jgi:siroheme synthase (precorrin-2 oxidase/ferrochelatase)
VHVPVSLDVAGRSVLVVGDGAVAARRADALAEAGAIVTRVAAHDYSRGDAGRYRLVLVDADPVVNAAVFEDAEAAGVWCNAADDPEHCSFVTPAVIRRGPVTVAVSTGGASPALSSWLRRDLEASVGPEFTEVALRLADERRRIHAEGGSTEDIDWTARIEALLARARAGHSG